MRAWHCLILVAVSGLLFLPNLGAHALWDMDEGVNAGCAREMLEAGTWVVPIFNGELRSAKPALLYWLQITSYRWLGVSEFAARLPSAILGIGTVLLTYELARRMFDAVTGLLAGVVLASCVQFNLLSHAATPDAPLMFAVTLTLLLAWRGQEGTGRNWLWWPAIPCGWAVLAKGPIGLAAPGLALLIYFAWNRELRRFIDARLGWGVLLFLGTVVPWLALVTAETKGEWLERFLKNENLNRIAAAQEHHSGPVFYYVVCLILLFVPWSAFLGPTARAGVLAALGRVPGVDPRPVRFLLAWMLAFVVPFSLVATKLPNYIAPAYPPLAVLTAWSLVRWARGTLTLNRATEVVVVASLVLTGLLFAAGFWVASGRTSLYGPGERIIPGLDRWAWLGGILVLAGGVMGVLIARDRRDWAVGVYAIASVAFLSLMAAFPVLLADAQKSAKVLATTSGAAQTDRDIRLAAVRYFQDSQSVVFYSGRRVEVLVNREQVLDFLSARGRYLFIPDSVWQAEFASDPRLAGVRVSARKYDLNRNAEILVVTTEPE